MAGCRFRSMLRTLPEMSFRCLHDSRAHGCGPSPQLKQHLRKPLGCTASPGCESRTEWWVATVSGWRMDGRLRLLPRMSCLLLSRSCTQARGFSKTHCGCRMTDCTSPATCSPSLGPCNPGLACELQPSQQTHLLPTGPVHESANGLLFKIPADAWHLRGMLDAGQVMVVLCSQSLP